jgi:hypothetical protein
MKYRNVIITLGFLVMIMQSLGFPQNMRNIFYVIIGALIITLGYLSNKISKQKKVQGPADSNTTNNISAHM